MFRVMHLLKRKDHLTHQEFREHFERSHVAMALKFCGHLFLEYRRNYIDQAWFGGDSRQAGSGYGLRPWLWDVASEWTLRDEATLWRIYEVMQQPGIDELFRADEDRIIDRAATVTFRCDVRDVGTVFDPRGTVFDTPTGEPRWN